MNRKLNLIVLLLAFYCLLVFSVQAQTTGFTYQGRLTDGSVPASGTYDLQFALFDAPSDGIQQPQPAPITVTSSAVQVTNGVFSVQLNFGASAFPGADRYLEIRVKKPAEAGYTTLNPRQRITSVPYAVRSLTAGQAESATTATTAASFSGSLTGEVSGTQNNTVVNSVGGVTAADVATGAQAANAATSLNTPNTIVKRNDSGGFSAGAVNITDYRLNVGPYGVLRVDGEPVNFGGAKPLAQFRSSFGSSSFNRDVFRISTDGGFAALGELGFGSIADSSHIGVRLMWSPYKAAFRAGGTSGNYSFPQNNQWNDANTGYYSWAGGYNTKASNLSSFAMGYETTASGDYTTAFGAYASTNNFAGSFVYGDSTGVSSENLPEGRFITSNAANSWTIRASGGYRFFTNPEATTGVSLSAGGGAWTTISDRSTKENFGTVNSREILRGVLNLPIQTWSYKGQSYRHIGATAQDFFAAFNVGENNRTITTVDPDGVALAAIQGLNEELKDRDQKIEQLEQQLKQQQTLVEGMKKLLCEQSPQAEICK